MAPTPRIVLKVSPAERFVPLLGPVCLLWGALADTGVSRHVGLAISVTLLVLLGVPAVRGGTQLTDRGVRLHGALFATIPWTAIRGVHPTGRSTRLGELGLQMDRPRAKPMPGSRIDDLSLVRDGVARHQPHKP